MQGAATIAHHPIHPMLVAFPLGLLVTALAADVIFLLWRRPFWSRFARAIMGLGVAGGLLAAIAGLTDYFTAPMTSGDADLATDHLSAASIAVGLFLVNFLARWRWPQTRLGPLLSLAGFLVIMYAGWLGGHLVYLHHIGVYLPRGGP